MKNAYLILTDLHYAVKKDHRKDYFGEILHTLTKLLDISQKYSSSGYNVNLVFLGDIIDGPISNPEDAMRCLDIFRYLGSEFNAMYTVLGNHEEHNVSNNPFWFMVSALEDQALSGLAKALQPQSLYSCITIPDKIVDGEVSIYFNHYGIQPKVPDTTGVNI